MKYLLATLLCLMPLSLMAADRTIAISGESTVKVEPDVAYIDISVVSKGETTVEARKQNSEAMNKLFATLKELKIDEKDIQTSNFSLRPEYHYSNEKEPELLGYIVSNQVNITICDLAQTGVILDKLVEDGANHVGGLRFGLTDKKEAGLENKARLAAVKNAENKVEQYAGALHIRIGKVISVQESVSGLREPIYGRHQLAAVSDQATPIAGGQVGVEVKVHVVWEIKDRIGGVLRREELLPPEKP